MHFLQLNFISAPSKRRSTNPGSASDGGGGCGGAIDSPCSSRASAVGSSYSEPWSCVVRDEDTGTSLQVTGSGGGVGGGSDGGSMAAAAGAAGHGGSTMVLRKRIRKIKEGMKK